MGLPDLFRRWSDGRHCVGRHEQYHPDDEYNIDRPGRTERFDRCSGVGGMK